MATKQQKPSRGRSEGLELLDYKQAAEYLGPAFTKRQVQRLVLEYGRIKGLRLSERRVVIERRELDRFRASLDDEA